MPSLFPYLRPAIGAPPDADVDFDFPEDVLRLPWTANKQNSWFDYRCWVEVDLDPGMVLHKPLPQFQAPADQLGTVAIDDPLLDKAVGGVNLAGMQVLDVIQRMATSTFRLILRGNGLRAGYQIPIPKLVSVAGVPAVPDIPQTAYNVIVGNNNGIPLWYAQWELAYIFASSFPPRTTGPVPFNAALHARPDAELPLDGVRMLRSATDQAFSGQSTLTAVLPGQLPPYVTPGSKT